MQQNLHEVLVVGSGAREHAILWGIHASAHHPVLYAAPGNPGMQEIAECLPLSTPDEIRQWAWGRCLLVVVGPETPLAEGLADLLRSDGHLVVGPSREAARLESSKYHAKEVMQRYGLPTARVEALFSREQLDEVIARETEWPHVLKQSRLAAGKGVAILHSRKEAEDLARSWGEDPTLFEEGLLWEQYLEGREVSVHVLTNGQEYLWLPLTQDHKRLTADPKSPNTGGMGAYGPVDFVSESLQEEINRRILDPVMRYLTDQGLLYRGVLYVGLMLTSEGPYVLEFNVRLGDPEAEVMIPLLTVDWYDVWLSLAQGQLPSRLPAPNQHAVAVVMAAEGYPGNPVQGQPIAISGIHGALVFHAGTGLAEHHLVSRGGRVLTVVGRGESREAARQMAYSQINEIHFPRSQYRIDIASS